MNKSKKNLKGFHRINDFSLGKGSYDRQVVFGPQHPTLKEPILFTFGVKGESVQQVNIQIGFNFRGIEKAFEQRTWIQNLYLVARICGMSSNAHQSSYSLAVEQLLGKTDTIPTRANVIRMILHELERIQSHLFWIGTCTHAANYEVGFQRAWKNRELALDILESISGSRLNYSTLTIGGVKKDINSETAQACKRKLKKLLNEIGEFYTTVDKEGIFVKRLTDIGILNRKDAKKYSTVGPTARASGIATDIRKIDPYFSYKELEFEVSVGQVGDMVDCLFIRFNEALESIRIVIELLDNLPPGDIVIEFNNEIKGPGTSLQRVEASRGENLHFLFAKEGITSKPYRLKIRAPTLANLPSLAHRLLGQYVADIPVIIRSIDPCVPCLERVTFVDIKTGKKCDMERRHLISRSNRAHRSGTRILNF